MHSHENVHEVLSVWQSALGELVRKVTHEHLVASHVIPHVGDAEFVVHGHADSGDLRQLQQGLLTGEHLLEEVLVEPVDEGGER